MAQTMMPFLGRRGFPGRLFRGLILVAGFLFSMSLVTRADDDLKLIGAGALTASRPYRGVKNLSTATPIVIWDYKNFYLKGVEAGYHFLKTDKLQLAVFLAPRWMGYHSSDSDALQGMEDREMSLDVGARAQFALPWEGRSVNVKIAQDALSRSNGYELELSASHKLKGSTWRLTPSFGVRAQSSRMTDYYYGVKADEVRPDRPEYTPGMAVNYFADTVFSFGIHKNWIVVTKGGLEFLSDEIRQSPLVKRDVLWSGFVGLARRF